MLIYIFPYILVVLFLPFRKVRGGKRNAKMISVQNIFEGGHQKSGQTGYKFSSSTSTMYTSFHNFKFGNNLLPSIFACAWALVRFGFPYTIINLDRSILNHRKLLTSTYSSAMFNHASKPLAAHTKKKRKKRKGKSEIARASERARNAKRKGWQGSGSGWYVNAWIIKQWQLCLEMPVKM